MQHQPSLGSGSGSMISAGGRAQISAAASSFPAGTPLAFRQSSASAVKTSPWAQHQPSVGIGPGWIMLGGRPQKATACSSSAK